VTLGNVAAAARSEPLRVIHITLNFTPCQEPWCCADRGNPPGRPGGGRCRDRRRAGPDRRRGTGSHAQTPLCLGCCGGRDRCRGKRRHPNRRRRARSEPGRDRGNHLSARRGRGDLASRGPGASRLGALAVSAYACAIAAAQLGLLAVGLHLIRGAPILAVPTALKPGP